MNHIKISTIETNIIIVKMVSGSEMGAEAEAEAEAEALDYVLSLLIHGVSSEYIFYG